MKKETLEEVAKKLIFETISGKYGLESIDEHDQVDGYFDTYLEAFLTLKLKWQQENSCEHNYILTAEQGHRIIKCINCNNIQPI